MAKKAGGGKRVEHQQQSQGKQRQKQVVGRHLFHFSHHSGTSCNGCHHPVGVDVVAGQFRHLPPVPQDCQACAGAGHLVNLAGDEDDGHVLLPGQLDHHFLDLRLGADVDAAGGLIQDQQIRLRHQPAGDDGLLLVAAGEVSSAGLKFNFIF